MRSRFLLFFPALFLACSSTDFQTGAPTDAGDDVQAGDSTSESSIDSGVDSGSTDTAVLDTKTEIGGDTGSGDTSVSDTTVSDSGTTDTGSDTGSGDGPACPAPPSTGTFDASALTCAQLQTEYPTAVSAATTCGCAADCSVTICESICCNCKAYVSPSSAGYPKAKAIYDEWTKRLAAGSCKSPICPLFACPGISLTGCLSSGTSGTTCVTKKGP